jgi:hypothetical protein
VMYKQQIKRRGKSGKGRGKEIHRSERWKEKGFSDFYKIHTDTLIRFCEYAPRLWVIPLFQ